MAYIDSTVAVARRILISPKLAGRQVSLQDSTDSSYGTVVDILWYFHILAWFSSYDVLCSDPMNPWRSSCMKSSTLSLWMLELGIFRGLESLLKAATGINDMVMKLTCLFFPRGQHPQFKKSRHTGSFTAHVQGRHRRGGKRVSGDEGAQFLAVNYSHILRKRNATMMIFSSILSADLTNTWCHVHLHLLELSPLWSSV